MRARGQGILTIALLGLVVLLATTFDRMGTKPAAEAAQADVPSGAWLCPHGGGEDWTAALYIANPGAADVTARITSIGPQGSNDPQTVRVPAMGQIRSEPIAGDRASSTYVEYFGGWLAAGWVTLGAFDENGVGAEPCSEAGRTWFSSGVSTKKSQQGYLVVMNPFAVDAVFDVAIFASPDRPPIRDSRLTDVTLRAGRSMAVRLNSFAEGEAAMAVNIEASNGRVGASTMVVADSGGITSVIASPSTRRSAYLPTSKGAGRSELSFAVPTGQGSEVGVLMLTQNAPQPIGGGQSQALEPTSARVLPIVTTTDASLDVSVLDGDPVIAALRTDGLGNDDGATGGAPSPATAWVVTPTVAGEPASPGLLILNPGDETETVDLRLLPRKGQPGGETSLEVPAASLVAVPGSFLDPSPDSSVMVTTDGAGVVALGASTSLGAQVIATFGLAIGVPIPQATS